MSSAGKIIYQGKALFICLLLFLVSLPGYCSGFEVKHLQASVETQSDTTVKIEEGKALHVNFYRTDSIFSMHSKKGYIPSLLHNFGAQATAPLHFSTKQWIYTGAAIGITAVLISLDGTIDTWAKPQKQDHPWIKATSPVATEFGNRYGAALVVAIGSVSAIFDKQKGLQTSLLATQAMITSGAWVRVMKLMTGRERPKGAYMYSHDEDGRWYGPFAEYTNGSAQKKAVFAYDAFPSGHTAIAFAIATVFASQYNDTRIFPVFCYSAAGVVGVTRLIEHEHWASDVFVGGLIGYLCGKQVVRYFNETHPGQNHTVAIKHQKKAELSLIQYGNQVGISIRW